MRRLALAAAAFVFVFAPAAARAEEPKLLRLPLEAKDVPAPHVEWYGLYEQGEGGKKIGWVHSAFEKAAAGDAWVVELTARIRSVGMGQKTEMEVLQRQEFDAAPPFAFRGGESRIVTSGLVLKHVRVGRGKEGLVAKLIAGGDERELPVPAPDYTLADGVGLERWIRQGRKVGDAATFAQFELDELRMDTLAATVVARKEGVAEGVPTTWYEVSQVTGLQGIRFLARMDSKGLPLSFVVGPYEARLEPEATAKKIEFGKDLFVEGATKIDKPIGEATKVTKLVVAVDGEGGAALVDGARQGVKVDPASKAVTLSLGAPYGTAPAATPSEVAEALEETVRYPIKDPRVVALAKEAVGDAQTPRERVARLVHFVDKYVENAIRLEEVSVIEVIASKKGDCSEHALLFATLARAAGVPARQVSGLMYMGDSLKAFGGHAWDEVALDGTWVPVDATWDELEPDATHVTLARGERMGDFLATMGKLSFRLLEVEPKPN
jgi:hypothetical protein